MGGSEEGVKFRRVGGGGSPRRERIRPLGEQSLASSGGGGGEGGGGGSSIARGAGIVFSAENRGWGTENWQRGEGGWNGEMGRRE